MKSILFSIVLTFFTFSNLFSQCPDAKANEYLSKSQQYGDDSYSILAAYYNRKCQCENGIGNGTAEQMVNMVNGLVDTYNAMKSHSSGSNGISIEGQHKVQWVNINKVSKCTKSKGIGNENNSSNSSSNSTSNNQKVASANPFTNLINENYGAAATNFLSMYLNRNRHRDVYTKTDNWKSNKGYWYKGSWRGSAHIGPWITAEDSEYKNVVVIENFEDTPDNEYHLKKQSTIYIMAGNFNYTISTHPYFEVYDKEDLFDKIVVCKKGIWDFEIFYYYTPNKDTYLTENTFKNRQLKYYYFNGGTYGSAKKIIKEYAENGTLIHHSEPYSKIESRYKDNGDIIYEFDSTKGIAHSFYDNGQLKYKINIDSDIETNGKEVTIFKPNGDISHTENIGYHKWYGLFHKESNKIIRYNDNGTISFKREYTTVSKKKIKYNDEYFKGDGSYDGTYEKIIKIKELKKGTIKFIK